MLRGRRDAPSVVFGFSLSECSLLVSSKRWDCDLLEAMETTLIASRLSCEDLNALDITEEEATENPLKDFVGEVGVIVTSIDLSE